MSQCPLASYMYVEAAKAAFRVGWLPQRGTRTTHRWEVARAEDGKRFGPVVSRPAERTRCWISVGRR